MTPLMEMSCLLDYGFIAIDGSCWTTTGYKAVIEGDKILRYESAPRGNYAHKDCDYPTPHITAAESGGHCDVWRASMAGAV